MKSENRDVLSFLSINDSATKQQFRVRFTTISLNVNQNKPILIKGVKWFVFSYIITLKKEEKACQFLYKSL